MSWVWSHAEFTCDRNSDRKRSGSSGPPPPPPPMLEKEYSRRRKRKAEKPPEIPYEEDLPRHEDEERSKRPYEPHDEYRPPCCEEHQPMPWHCEEDECWKPHKKLLLKALVVVAEEEFEKFGTLELTAPPGITVDPETGKVKQSMRLEPIGEPVFKPAVLPDKLVNEGFLRAKLVIDGADGFDACSEKCHHEPIHVVIPFQSIHEIEGICPGDHVQEHAEIEGLLISAAQNVCKPNGTTVKLTLKAILKASVVIARECLVSVPGKTIKCLKQA